MKAERFNVQPVHRVYEYSIGTCRRVKTVATKLKAPAARIVNRGWWMVDGQAMLVPLMYLLPKILWRLLSRNMLLQPRHAGIGNGAATPERGRLVVGLRRGWLWL